MILVRKSAFILIPLLLAAGCSESINDPADFTVDEACNVDTRPIPPPAPEQVVTTSAITSMQQLWDAMGIDNGTTVATRVAGDLPAPAGITQGFTFFQEVIVSDKSELPIPIISTTVPTGKRIGAIFFQIEGINEYAILPISGGQSFVVRGPIPPEDQPDLEMITQAFEDAFNAAGQDLIVRALLVNEGEAVDPAATSFSANAADWMAPSSEIESSTIPVLKPQSLGTGGMQITLVWDTEVDIDLFLIEPSGHTIDYGSLVSDAGDGELDRDDRDGFGAENIVFSENIPDGNYQIQVDYFGPRSPGGTATPSTNYTVIVKACGATRTFTGILEEVGSNDSLLTFYHSANCSLTQVASPSDPDFIEEASLCDIPSKDYPIATE